MEKEVRLIDADKLKNHYSWWEGGSQEMTLDRAKQIFDTIIDVQPTVDAEPVVRCKDCKYCSVDGYADGNVPDYVCINMDCGVEADGFCSWGERKEDAKTD